MSHSRAICAVSATIAGMRRLALLSLLGAPLIVFGCSKSAGTKEKPDDTLSTGGAPDKVAVPGATGGGAPGGTVGGEKTDETRFKLQPEEGTLAVEAPTGAKAGAEAIVKVTVTPTSKYKVNTEFPIKLTLQNADGVTISKTELRAGGQDHDKGDAETLEESKLAFAVKLTPAKSGSYTINGSFKFAVCDRAGSTCLAKKEPIAIQVAAQ